MGKFPVGTPRWEPNQDINNIQGLIDFVVDDFGNYYTPYRTAIKDGRLEEVVLCHCLYDEAFSTIFLQDDIKEEYKYSHLGDLLLDRLNGHIEELNKNGRKIFHVSELFEQDIKVAFWDITKAKTLNKTK